MQVDGIRSAQDLFTQASDAATGEELGRTAFLELMIAQLEAQDPLNPTQNEDFVAQLAQFSSLEGIENLNISIGSMAADLRSSLAVDAASLVGRNVLAPAQQSALSDGPIRGAVVVSADATDVLLEVRTPAGEPVRQISLGPVAAGQASFAWDGTDNDGNPLPPGDYRFRAVGAVDGEPREFTTKLPDRVVSVSLIDGEVRVNTQSGNSVPLNQIDEVT